MAIQLHDEYLHRAPAETKTLFSDNFWFSICDREADVFGVIHLHVALNKGYARFSTMLVIDGVPQPWANKFSFATENLQFEKLTEGNLIYEVIKPLEEMRIRFKGPKYSFDLRYKGRFPVFDYKDCHGGNPLTSAEYYNYGGHYEQGMHCSGDFEVHAGPKPGLRKIDCYSHRDHSWTNRFGDNDTPWELPLLPKKESLFHFWPSIQTDKMHLNGFGWMNPDFSPIEGAPRCGGFISDENGTRPIKEVSCEEIRTEADNRTAMSFRYRFVLPDDQVIHVRTGRKYAHTVNGQMRGENDAECTLDCYESFFDYEVEETGERGYGCSEYSIIPVYPRWRY